MTGGDVDSGLRTAIEQAIARTLSSVHHDQLSLRAGEHYLDTLGYRSRGRYTDAEVIALLRTIDPSGRVDEVAADVVFPTPGPTKVEGLWLRRVGALLVTQELQPEAEPLTSGTI